LINGKFKYGSDEYFLIRGSISTTKDGENRKFIRTHWADKDIDKKIITMPLLEFTQVPNSQSFGLPETMEMTYDKWRPFMVNKFYDDVIIQGHTDDYEVIANMYVGLVSDIHILARIDNTSVKHTLCVKMIGTKDFIEQQVKKMLGF